MTDREKLELAERVEAARTADNFLDVECEVALFKPGRVYTAARANVAGTKVIYTDVTGNEITCWAEDWTRHPVTTAAALRALSTESK